MFWKMSYDGSVAIQTKQINSNLVNDWPLPLVVNNIRRNQYGNLSHSNQGQGVTIGCPFAPMSLLSTLYLNSMVI